MCVQQTWRTCDILLVDVNMTEGHQLPHVFKSFDKTNDRDKNILFNRFLCIVLFINSVKGNAVANS